MAPFVDSALWWQESGGILEALALVCPGSLHASLLSPRICLLLRLWCAYVKAQLLRHTNGWSFYFLITSSYYLGEASPLLFCKPLHKLQELLFRRQRMRGQYGQFALLVLPSKSHIGLHLLQVSRGTLSFVLGHRACHIP